LQHNQSQKISFAMDWAFCRDPGPQSEASVASESCD
jgi:hypothetical protein